ncbi:MAG: M1 family metallopeptidase [Actinomycetia bacterium]|nr:M1 family metallopeptidase [Actinomycetes bacterium]
MNRRLVGLGLVVGLLTSACSSISDPVSGPPTVGPSSSASVVAAQPTTTAVPMTTPAPTTTTTVPPLSAGTRASIVPYPFLEGPVPPPAPAACPAVPTQAVPDPHRPVHVVDVDVDPTTGMVQGSLGTRFRPDLATDRLVYRLWPNAPRPAAAGTSMAVSAVTVDGQPAVYERPDTTTLVIDTGPLEVGDEVTVALEFTLEVAGPIRGRVSRNGDALRLGSFVPLLAWEPGGGWMTEPATAGFAEAAGSTVADWTLTIRVPEGYDVLATGERDGDTWRLPAGRDVAASVGRFELAEAIVAAPDPVLVTVGVHAGIGDSPTSYLDKAAAVLTDFGARFGPYPFPTLTLAITPGLNGGIEFPSHIQQGPGTLGRVTSHEIGHMWFYALVGNNQGREPVIDEGLATYAESRWESTSGSVAGRSIPSSVAGRAGEPMTFWESHLDSYYRGVYIQGAAGLIRLGDLDLVDCALRHFVAVNAHRIATQADLIASLETVFPDAAATLAPFGLTK